MSIRLNLLGRLRLQVGGSEARLESRTVEALLAYLALYRDRPHARERLAGLFWPEMPDQQARMNLRHALYALRRALGPEIEIVIADRRAVQLNPEAPLWVDALEFERLLRRSERVPSNEEQRRLLRRAIELYKGPLLEGFYHDWALAEQQRFRELFLAALVRRAELDLARGAYEQALDGCERALREDPYREEAYACGMLALARAGRAAEALKLYERCRAALAELRLEPGPYTRQLAEWVTQGKLLLPRPPQRPVKQHPPAQERDPRERAWRLRALGDLARERGELDRAERLYHEALGLALRGGDREGVVEARTGLGLLLWQRGLLRPAHEELKRALRVARALQDQDPRCSARVLLNVGIVAMQRGRFAEARRCYVEALWLYRRLRDPGGVARALNNLAILAYHQEDYPTAHRLFERVRKAARRLGDLKLAARALNNLGNLARKQRHYDEAEERLTAALELFEELNDPREVANTLANLGAVALERGDLPQARGRLKQALRLALEADARGIAHYALVRFAQLHLAEGDPERAAQIAHAVREEAEPGSWPHRRAGRLLQGLPPTPPEARSPGLEALVPELLRTP